ncbi:hypothetical protein GF337_12580 [candidate division KSB1 bacterium]|nr:hypothetical protein [candidate division KSB1 bacterium]
MQRQFNRLKDRVSTLSNHHQKFIRVIEKYGELLIDRLEEKGRIEKVHLWKKAYNLSEEMDIVADVARDEKEKSIFLGCYYAFQILHMNLNSVDVLMWNLTRTEDKIPVYKQFMLDVGRQFRLLTSAYMKKIIDSHFSSENSFEYTFSSVGSLAHQDDLDVGIIDNGSGQRAEFNKAIGKLRNEMLKWALEMHLYLSEHVGEQTFSASINEYRDLLDKEIGDFVIISEMLMAVPILGSNRLFYEFVRKVIRRYYFHPNRDNIYHEGYIRSIIGEVRSLLSRQIHDDMLHLKNDGLRMLLGVILAGRTIFRIYHGNRWDVLAVLMQRDSQRKSLYQELEKAVTFLEVFRHMYQLFVAQEEEIYLDDPNVTEQMELVARTLGYDDFGAIKAWDHLLIHYHEIVQQSKEVSGKLLEEVTQHLKSISIFNPMIKGTWDKDPYRSYPGNVAIDFLRKSAFFKYSEFWDDVLEAIADDKSHVLVNFINDLCKLKPRYQELIIKKYSESSERSIYTMINFLIQLSRNKRKYDCEHLYERFNHSFLQQISENDERSIQLTKVFNQFPGVINDYLLTLDAKDQQRFMGLLDGELWSKEEFASKKRLVYLCKLHFSNSHYFKRFFVRVIGKYPEYIQYLQDVIALEQIAKGFLGSVDSVQPFKEKKKQLGHYYDLEFLRIGLETIHGAPIEKINEEFTEFSDTYLQSLFDICKKSVDEHIGKKISTKDLFAVFVAGGHAREQAFDDDYDIIMFLNDTDEEIKEYVTKIVMKMNAEIIKRGIMPHYRFANIFGEFVTLLDELDAYFDGKDEDTFIDKSQILGARMIVGSTKFEKSFAERIVKPHIFYKRENYIAPMIAEIESRHRHNLIDDSSYANIKETTGGLRDIEMVLLIYKAKYELSEPINRKLVESIYKIDPCDDFNFLIKASNFLKNLRDLYRLTVAAEDELNFDYLDRVAHIMGFENSPSYPAAQKLKDKYLECTEQVSSTINKLIDNMRVL